MDIKKKGIIGLVKKVEYNSIQLINFVYFLFHYFFLRDRCVFVKAWVKVKAGKLFHNNWGDDLNYYLLQAISGKKVVFYPLGKIGNFFDFTCFLGIGSIFSVFSLDKTIIIGSGVRSDSDIKNIRGIPQKVVFVRGPISRRLLCERGITVPERYGDLGLVLPLLYSPSISKKNSIGIVLHSLDEKLNVIKVIMEKFSCVKLIYMRGYHKWTDIINEIVSCEIVFSSSLHGLICAEAYKIPCQWVCFSENRDNDIGVWPRGWELKFFDFFSSIGKGGMQPVRIDQETDILKLKNNIMKTFRPINYDPKVIMDALTNEIKL